MKRALAALLAAPLLLTACTNQPAELGAIDHINELQAHLTGTDWECSRWHEYDDGHAVCSYPDSVDGVAATVVTTTDPEMYSALSFDSDSKLDATIIGGNWLFMCEDLTSAECGEVAAVLGGEVIERGHWSN